MEGLLSLMKAEQSTSHMHINSRPVAASEYSLYTRFNSVSLFVYSHLKYSPEDKMTYGICKNTVIKIVLCVTITLTTL